MLVGQWMAKAPVTIGPKESIVQARTIMREHGIRRLPVVEGDSVVGIVADRDLREAWASDATTLAVYELNYMLDRVPVRDVMTCPAITVTPETSLEAAVALMGEKKIGALPVLSDGQLVGILTDTDVFRAFAQVLHYGNVEGRPDLPPQVGPPAGRVLVPVLGTPLSRKAVHEACRLAVQFGVRPKVLLILRESVDMEDFRSPGDRRTLDQIIGGILSEYRNIAESLGVKIETEFRSGEPATVALEEITSNQYDFVIVGRRTPLHLGLSRLELEKVGFAARLLEASPIPVLVVSEAAQL